MYKVSFASLILISTVAHADTTPTFDANTGILALPFVSTTQGAYSATLQLNATTPTTTFKINAVATTTLSGSLPLPTFDFASGLLTLPKVNAGTSIYSAKLVLNAQQIFSVTELKPYTETPLIIPNGGPSIIGGCNLFPSNNVWNTRIDTLPIHTSSNAWIYTISSLVLRNDFGNAFGQPYNVITGSQTPRYTFSFQFPDESNNESYPIPNNFLRETTDDNRLFIIDKELCRLYEVYNAQQVGTQWFGRRGAIWDLKSNALRTSGWGSADDAGLPQVPGLVRYEEILSGSINHALRFSVPKPISGRVWPARTNATDRSSTVSDAALPMGARLRLKSTYNISGFSRELQVILQAMKTYGIILADSSSFFLLSGTPDSRWDDELLFELRKVKGIDFEVVNTNCMIIDQNSGEADVNRCK